MPASLAIWRVVHTLLKQPRLFTTSTYSFSTLKTFRSQWFSATSIWSPAQPVLQRCGFRSSAVVSGLEEFFPVTDNPVEEGEQSGRPWLARELRNKNSEDLHKLWYVLLKERNMLMTVRQEANRQLFVMPGPERLRKVRRSMARIKVVLFERERALKQAKHMLKQPTDEMRTAESAVKRPKSYKIRKLIVKNRIRPIKDYKLFKKVEKKRRNVRNYKHIKAVRELELKG